MSSPLDPDDWDDFASAAHALLDECVAALRSADDRPWQPVPGEIAEGYRLARDEPGIGHSEAAEALVSNVLPYHTGNTHPRFFGWVHGTGLASGLLSEMVAATMNSNCGGRNHGAVYVERALLDWCKDVFDFPTEASGVMVTGTSQATVIALAAARQRALGPSSRGDGVSASGAQLAAYALDGVHTSTQKALELIGVGGAWLRRIPAGPTGAMDPSELGRAISADREAGRTPFAVIATAGSVDIGSYDDLDGLADLASQEGLWLHVDGAFGAWTRLAAEPWRHLTNGIGRADSIAFDFHKWMSVPYDCGVALIRDQTAHTATFSNRPAYLAYQSGGLGAGNPWFCDYGTDLSRGFRALKAWTAVKTYGTSAFGEAITRNIEQAHLMGRLIEAEDSLMLAAPVRSNVVCFGSSSPEAPGGLHAEVAQTLQYAGEAVLSTTKIGGRVWLRAAIVNHRTTDADIAATVRAVVNHLTGMVEP